jgi:heme A synthase
MRSSQTKLVGVTLFFLLIFVSGIWLSTFEKPYPSILFTIHKLLGVAVGVLLGVTVYRRHQVTPLGGVEIAAVATTALFFVGTVASGGLLSVDLAVPAIVQTLHQALPALTVLSTAGTLYLLLRGTQQTLALGE